MSQGKKCDIPEEQVMRLLERGYNMHQAALFFRVSPTTIKTHFGELWKTYGQGRLARIKLLDVLWNHAIKTGNKTALEYLMYEYLNYTPSTQLDVKTFAATVKDLSHEELAKKLESKAKELREVKEEGSE